MGRLIILILILSSVLTGSCGSRRNKVDHSGMIPEKDLVLILTDVHITDGLLSLPVVFHWFTSIDSLSAYVQVIEKYGYTKETMDKTMKYYFMKNPKKLIKIYDKVLGVLSEMETHLEQESAEEASRALNLWRGKEFYVIPDRYGTDSTGFSVSLSSYGIYTVSFTSTVMPDDQSVNPRFTAYSCNADSLETGVRKYYETIGFLKDAQKHLYSVSVKVPAGTRMVLQGNFLGSDNYSPDYQKHATIEEISLVLSPILE